GGGGGEVVGGVGGGGGMGGGGVVGRVVAAIGERRTFVLGLLASVIGLGSAAVAPGVPLFLLFLTPLAIGSALCTPSIAALISRQASVAEQGTIQGAASALQSLGRTIGPVWGTAVMQRLGDSAAFGLGSLLLAATTALVVAGTSQAGSESPRAAA